MNKGIFGSCSYKKSSLPTVSQFLAKQAMDYANKMAIRREKKK